MAYNRVHDSRGEGDFKAEIYIDDSNKVTKGVTVHHNLVYDTARGIYLKGSDNVAYNNTLWNAPGGAVVPSYAEDDLPDSSIEVVNNLSNNSGHKRK